MGLSTDQKYESIIGQLETLRDKHHACEQHIQQLCETLEETVAWLNKPLNVKAYNALCERVQTLLAEFP